MNDMNGREMGCNGSEGSTEWGFRTYSEFKAYSEWVEASRNTYKSIKETEDVAKRITRDTPAMAREAEESADADEFG